MMEEIKALGLAPDPLPTNPSPVEKLCIGANVILLMPSKYTGKIYKLLSWQERPNDTELWKCATYENGSFDTKELPAEKIAVVQEDPLTASMSQQQAAAEESEPPKKKVCTNPKAAASDDAKEEEPQNRCSNNNSA